MPVQAWQQIGDCPHAAFQVCKQPFKSALRKGIKHRIMTAALLDFSQSTCNPVRSSTGHNAENSRQGQEQMQKGRVQHKLTAHTWP